MPAILSLIVPTRGRVDLLRRLLDSLAATASDIEYLEVVLVVDADDPESQAVVDSRLKLRTVVVAPGRTMGHLNRAGVEAAAGEIVMLLNDDVVARTPSWDRHIRTCFDKHPDGIVLAHVNDLVFQKNLCTFPIVSRRFVDLAGGICPEEYQRYRIDDHIEDIFNLLGVLGERRSVYLPEVVFEHHNYVTNAGGVRQYFSDPAVLAQDAPVFDRFAAARKELALRLKCSIAGADKKLPAWRKKLDAVKDHLALRTPERLRVMTLDELNGVARWWHRFTRRQAPG